MCGYSGESYVNAMMEAMVDGNDMTLYSDAVAGLAALADNDHYASEFILQYGYPIIERICNILPKYVSYPSICLSIYPVSFHLCIISPDNCPLLIHINSYPQIWIIKRHYRHIHQVSICYEEEPTLSPSSQY